MSLANGWIVVCPLGREEAGADGDSILYIEYTERKKVKKNNVLVDNLPARPNDGTVRGTVASGWLDDAGDISGFGAQPWYPYRDRIGAVKVLDTWIPDDGKYLFDGLNNCSEFDLLQLDTSRCASFEGMFRGCSAVVQLLELDRLQTGGVSDTSQMFMNCLRLKAVSIAGWDVSNIVSTDHMLSGCATYVLASDEQADFLNLVTSGGSECGVWRRINQ